MVYPNPQKYEPNPNPKFVNTEIEMKSLIQKSKTRLDSNCIRRGTLMPILQGFVWFSYRNRKKSLRTTGF